jgi:anti-sigma28 factor (negative regulator of flagellin synthesis)
MGFKSGPAGGTEQEKAAEAKKLANSLEESRKNRLNKVRKELEAGKYRVSAKDIARKIIDDSTK